MPGRIEEVSSLSSFELIPPPGWTFSNKLRRDPPVWIELDCQVEMLRIAWRRTDRKTAPHLAVIRRDADFREPAREVEGNRPRGIVEPECPHVGRFFNDIEDRQRRFHWLRWFSLLRDGAIC